MSRTTPTFVVVAAIVFGACGGSLPQVDTPVTSTSTTTSTSTSTTIRTTTTISVTTTTTDSAELEAWKDCMTQRIESMSGPANDEVAAINSEIEWINLLIDDDEVAREYFLSATGLDHLSLTGLDAAEDSTLHALQSGLRERGLGLEERRSELVGILETADTLVLARNGATAANIDWSLCTGS